MKTVVVIDDNEVIREMVAEVLEDENYQVVPLSDTQKIDEVLAETNPSCVLMDVMLPGEYGDKAVSRLKKEQQFSRLPMMLMSATKDIDKRAEDCMADAFIRKPFNNEQLVCLVTKYCQ